MPSQELHITASQGNEFRIQRDEACCGIARLMRAIHDKYGPIITRVEINEICEFAEAIDQHLKKLQITNDALGNGLNLVTARKAFDLLRKHVTVRMAKLVKDSLVNAVEEVRQFFKLVDLHTVDAHSLPRDEMVQRIKDSRMARERFIPATADATAKADTPRPAIAEAIPNPADPGESSDKEDRHAPYFPSDAFPSGVQSDRLAHAAKDEGIKRIKVGKRWHYSWPDAQKKWPQLIPRESPEPQSSL